MRYFAVALFALVSTSAFAQSVTADCTTSCRLVADPDPGMTVGLDKCQLWNGATKVVENFYAGGTITSTAGAVIPVGCVFNITVADGATVNLQANHWRLSDNRVTPSGNILTLTSVKALPPPSAPLNLRLAAELRAIADKIAAGKPLE
jgi:hypothetical protein